MSLYDQFFSDINKDFMFNMANNVLKKDYNITIEGDENVKNEYLEDMKDIFEKNDFEDISEINKVLLDTTIKKNRGSNIEEKEDEKEQPSGFRKMDEDKSEDSETRLAELMKERESIQIPPQEEQTQKVESGTSIDDLLKNATGTKIETIVEEDSGESEVFETEIVEKEETPVFERNLKLVSFTSNKRTSIIHQDKL